MQNIKSIFLLCMLGLSWSVTTQAELVIDVTPGEAKGIPIGIVPFKWAGAGNLPQDVSGVISADLSRTGQFSVLTKGDLPQTPATSSEINAEQWRSKSIDNVVVGRITAGPNGTFEVNAELVNVYDSAKPSEKSPARVVRTIRKVATTQSLRLAAHQVANEIYQALTSIEGVFDTKIAYVTSIKGRDGKRQFSLIVADYDGYAPVSVKSSVDPILSPAWAPDGERLAYVQYASNGYYSVYIHNIVSRSRQQLTANKGKASSPAWSPDGTQLAFTQIKDGNSEIYTFDLRTRSVKRVTVNPSIDTEAAWTPDGRYLVFTSDRGRTPQLYKIPATGGRAERLTFSGNYNARPSFSPDGKNMTLVHQVDSKFSIGLMKTGDSAIQVLTDGRLDESPSFSPNGYLVIYASEYNHRGVLSTVSIVGRHKQRIGYQEGDIREPAWGPKRKK